MGIPNSTEKQDEPKDDSVDNDETSTHVSEGSASGDAGNLLSMDEMTRTEKMLWQVQKRQDKIEKNQERMVRTMKENIQTMNENIADAVRQVQDLARQNDLPLTFVQGDQSNREISSLSNCDGNPSGELDQAIVRDLKITVKDRYYKNVKFADDDVGALILEAEIREGRLKVPVGATQDLVMEKNKHHIKKYITELRQNSTTLAKKNWRGKAYMSYMCG